MLDSIHILKNKPVFLRVVLAFFISGIGTAFTSVAIYQEFAAQNIGAIGFAIVFVAGLLPGFITSSFAANRYKAWPVFTVLIAGQLLGLIALAIPLIGSYTHNVFCLLVAEIVASAIGGVLLPIYKTIERSSFADNELNAVAPLDTFLFTANFIFGQGLGSLLASQLSLRQFLFIDFISYAIAAGLFFSLKAKLDKISQNQSDNKKSYAYRDLSSTQKKSLWLLPWLSFVCAPLMVLLPARGIEFSQPLTLLSSIKLTPVLFIICSRTLGQLAGPFLASHWDLAKLSSTKWSLPLSLLLYIGFYSLALNTGSLLLVGVFCCLAHVASNVVYCVGNYQLLANFNSEQAGWAATIVYRAMTIVTVLSSLVGGLLVQKYGWSLALLVSVVSWLVGSIYFNFQNKTQERSCSVHAVS